MELFKYQKDIVNKAVEYLQKSDGNCDNKFNLFLQMGLGKTVIALEITKELGSSAVLVVCPKSLIEMWAYNISKILPGHSRIDAPEHLTDCVFPVYCVVNYEQLRNTDESIIVDMCIFDEVHKIKNVSTKLHERIHKIIRPFHVLNLTGTPITRDYMDLFGILTGTGEQRFRQYNAAQFKYRYITNGGTRRTQELMAFIEPYSVFGDICQYIDMPDAYDIVIPVKLTLEQYAELNIIYNSKENALARITKAQQITSGIFGKYLSPKQVLCIQLIRDIVSDGEKVVLFCKYDDEFDFFTRFFGNQCVGINGKTKDRETPVHEFQNNPDIKLFVGNLQTAGTGITLTKACKCIFYSETYTWGDFEQSKARIYRIGQNAPCVYYHLLAENTVDELIYKSNLDKTDLIEEFKKQYGGN